MLAEQLTGQVTSHLSELAQGTLIHSQVVPEFIALQQAAKIAGFNLQIASGFRSFERQKYIWNNKYLGNISVLDKHEHPLNLQTLSEQEKLLAILHWSALPGASRHHWGTDFDVFDPNLLPVDQKLQLKVSEYTNGGYFSELSDWLSKNTPLFGFFLPYQNVTGGVASEPWHISYSPIAFDALNKLDLGLVSDIIMRNNVCGKSIIYEQLPMIYNRFICNINHQSYGGQHVRKT